MKRVITFSFCVFAIVAFSFSTFAQNISVSPNQVTETTGQTTIIDAGGVIITHSATQSIVSGSISCNDGTNHTDNSYWRSFVLADFGIADDFKITTVEIGVETAAGAGGTQPITVNLYTTDAPFPGGTLTLIGTASVVVADQTLSIFPIAVTGTAPAGSELVVEIFTPNGQIDGNSFFIGSNPDGQTAPSYISAADCGIIDPTDVAAIGFPDMMIVMNVTGDVNAGDPLVCNEDFFDVDILNWTWIGPLGSANWIWSATNLAGGASAGELNFHWSPGFVGDSYLISKVIVSNGYTVDISFWSLIDWFGDPMRVSVAWTIDDGVTLNTIWEVIDPGGIVGPEFVQLQAPGNDNFRLVFCWNGDTFMIDDWWIDDVSLCFTIPVELTSFAATVSDRNVTLNWTTATELNNQGFDVERNSGNGFEKIGFVPGFGTSTEIHNYSYVDGSLQEGSYSFRLKQVDFDGTFEYSDVVEVDVTVPKVFALEQNFPNPFNPSTMINFSLAADSKVNLTVFDILGQEVANLISGNLAAGFHEINFNASNINSGVYFYRIDATAVDGTSFSSIKKMILLK